MSPDAVWAEMKSEKNRVIAKLRGDLEKSFSMLGIKRVQGKAAFESKNSITVETAQGKSSLPFDKAVIAAGSAPAFPPPTDQFLGQILNSDTIFEIERAPESLVIVGGGAVGCEFACLFNALGSKVTIIEKTGGLVPGEDPGIVQALRKIFEARGIEVFDSITIEQLKREGSGWDIRLSNQKEIKTEALLVCTGRRPETQFLNLDAAGIGTERNRLILNDGLQTSNPNVYAAGDVTGLSLLAHSGTAQGECAARNALGENVTYDGSLVPRCLYTWPEVASVGQWKEGAEKAGISVKGQRYFFQGSARALAENQTDGFVQILSHAETGKILGAQMIGPGAAEIIHILSVALKNQMTRDSLREVIFAHPTFSEGIRWALER